MVVFVSLGMSCQTTHQLNYFAENAGRSVKFVKSPFDWLICPPDSCTRWLKENLRDFRLDELCVHRGRVFWPHMNLWFWHGFFDRTLTPPVLNLEAQFANELSKLRSLRERFCSIDPTVTHFVLSNTQNNLPVDVFSKTENEQYFFDERCIDQLIDAMQQFYRTDVSLHVVTRIDRCTQGLTQRANVHLLPDDESEWKGNKTNWSALLDRMVLG